MRGWCQHFWITLQLNYQSWRSLSYGYLMPVLFLLGFGSVFQQGQPRLLEQMGQILTITILGSTCMGMATALVSERERGLWRRYELLPIPTHYLLLSVAAVRLIIVLLAVLLQLVLARWIYGTPFPTHGWAFAAILPVVFAGFLGLGLMLAALAKDVPSVQALGQCIFLPMILIGGVGIPLSALPDWAAHVACFMPGRYAVELLQACYRTEMPPWTDLQFALLSLVGIGACASIAAFRLVRWDTCLRLSRSSVGWISFALIAWAGVGGLAMVTDRTASSIPLKGPDSLLIGQNEIAHISFEILPEDHGFYAPLAPPLAGQRLTHRMTELQPRLNAWAPGKMQDPMQTTLNLLSVAAIADISQDRSEAIVARMVFDQLKLHFDEATLTHTLAWVILNPDQGRVITSAPELGFVHQVNPQIARERCDWYARKFLGRLIGKIPENP